MTDPTPRAVDGQLVKPDSLAAKALGIVGLVVGVGFGKYCGPALFIPAVAGGLAAWVLSKTLSEDRKPLTAAIAVQAGQIVAILVGLTFFSEKLSEFGPQTVAITGAAVVINCLGLAWLIAAPSWLSTGALTLFQLVAMADGFYTLSLFEPGAPEHKGFVATIGLRLFAVVCLVAGMRTIAKARQAERDHDDEPDQDVTLPAR